MLPCKAGVDTDAIFERLCLQVAETPIATKSGPLSITISIGVAYVSSDKSIDELLDEADGALYQAKSEGRNRVVRVPDIPVGDPCGV